MTTRKIISKSKKKKCSSAFNDKADDYTMQVVYHTKVDGKTRSITKHEKV